MNMNDIPIWEKYTLTVEEASKYFYKAPRLISQIKQSGWTALYIFSESQNLFVYFPIQNFSLVYETNVIGCKY